MENGKQKLETAGREAVSIFYFLFSIFYFLFSVFGFRFSIFHFPFSIFDFRFSVFLPLVSLPLHGAAYELSYA